MIEVPKKELKVLKEFLEETSSALSAVIGQLMCGKVKVSTKNIKYLVSKLDPLVNAADLNIKEMEKLLEDEND